MRNTPSRSWPGTAPATTAQLLPTLATTLLVFACGCQPSLADAGAVAAPPAATATGPGLVAQKPSSGRFVKTDAGYMVPYRVTIPGSQVSFEMVPIPGGTFKLGSPSTEADRGKDEGPQVEIRVEPFWMGKHEVTWDEYDLFIDIYEQLSARPPQKIAPDDEADAVSFPTPIYPQDAIPVLQRMGREGGFPAADMTQFGAKQYTKWLTTITGQVFRLPTEGEWEYACRAGTTTAFFFGDDAEKLGDYAWHFDNSEWEDGEHGHPDSDQGYRKVGEKKPNPWGLHDILGNVSEWVVDQYAADHYAKIAPKGPLSAVDAAAWPTKVYPRIIRGGHWDSDPEDCRSAARLASEKDWKIQDPQLPKSVWYHTEAWWAGFRLVRPLRTPDSKVLAQFWDADVQGIRDVLKLDKQRRADVKTIRSLIKPAE